MLTNHQSNQFFLTHPLLGIKYYTEFPKNLSKNFNPGQLSVPFIVEVHPTNKCNFSCSFCYYKNLRSQEELSLSQLISILTDLKDMGVSKIIISGGGEPLIHPHIKEILQYAHKLDLPTILKTNGLFIDSKLIETINCCMWVRISLDAANPATFGQLKGTNKRAFEKVIYNTTCLIKGRAKKLNNNSIGLGFIVHKGNIHEIIPFIKLAHHLKVDFVHFRPVVGNQFQPSITQIKNISKQIKKDLTDSSFANWDQYLMLFQNYKNRRTCSNCDAINFFSLIAADSGVYPCCQQGLQKKYYIDSIKHRPFSSIWKSKNYHQMRRKIEGENLSHHPPCAFLEYFRNRSVKTSTFSGNYLKV